MSPSLKTTDDVEFMPPFLKALIYFLLMMIPMLGYFILRSDPIIYSNNIQKDEATVKQVQAFAKFIQNKPELAVHQTVTSKSPTPSASLTKMDKSEARERVSELEAIWRENPPAYDMQWRNQVEKLFAIAKESGSEEALDLIQAQIMTARSHSDDLNREAANRWFEQYAELEKRESKLNETADLFREKVIQRIENDERARREGN